MGTIDAVFVNPPTPGNRKITRNVDCASESKGNYLLQPFDFLQLSGTFPTHARIRVIDAVADRLDPDRCFREIAAKPLNLIVTAIVDATWEDDYAFLTRLRKTYPDTPILVFGDALLENDNAEQAELLADGIITSPLLFNPAALTELTRSFVREHRAELGLRTAQGFGASFKTPKLKSIHTPRHELFLHPRYRWPFSGHRRYSTVTISWGCPFSCSYCTASKLPSLYRSAEEVLKELEHLRSLGIKEVYFGDKSFGIPLKTTQDVLNGMVERELKFSWSTYFHPNVFSPAFLDLMKKSGCHTIIIGIETAEVASLRRFNRNVTQQKTEALIEYANSIGINVCGDFILGLPDEDEDEILKTLDYACGLDLDYASFNIASPLPASSIKALAIADRRMQPDEHHFDSVGKGRVLASNRVSAERLESLRNQAVRRFYFRPRSLLKRLTRLRGPEHLWIQIAEAFEILRKTS